MPAPYSGKCACGAVTAMVNGEPLGIRLCYCRECQQVAGGGPTSNAVFQVKDIALTGELAHHSNIAASGNTLSKFFCPKCGTPVYGQSSARTHLASIRLGFLDVGHGLRPDTSIWLSESPDWATIDPDLPQFPQQAPAPVVPED
jgi:hypothetical protein